MSVLRGDGRGRRRTYLSHGAIHVSVETRRGGHLFLERRARHEVEQPHFVSRIQERSSHLVTRRDDAVVVVVIMWNAHATFGDLDRVGKMLRVPIVQYVFGERR